MPGESGNDVDEIATGWVARLDSEGWTSADEDALDAWLGQDKRHQGAFLQAHALWLALDAAAERSAGAAKVDNVRRTFLLGGGAALAASLVGGVALWRKGKTITTSVGEIRRFPLPDGSVAAINTASEVKIAYADHHRDVDLKRGEAWFQVSSNPRRPFLVEAGAVRVLAVGTAFSVRRRDQGADILVTEGVVSAWTAGRDHDRLQLHAGERIFLSDTAEVRKSAARSIDQSLAWRNGRIDLQGETLAAAIDEFNRYNQRQLVLDDPALASERLDGFFWTDDVEGFAKALRVTFNVPISTNAAGEIRIGSRGSRSL